jgi:hypothetical protein
MFCRSLFVLLYFFFWPLYCMFFFDIRILITPLCLQTLLTPLLSMLTSSSLCSLPSFYAHFLLSMLTSFSLCSLPSLYAHFLLSMLTSFSLCSLPSLYAHFLLFMLTSFSLCSLPSLYAHFLLFMLTSYAMTVSLCNLEVKYNRIWHNHLVKP